jgi:hypothetical protein
VEESELTPVNCTIHVMSVNVITINYNNTILIVAITDVFEDFLSPVTAAQALLHAVCRKRKDMLQKSMGFILQVLTANPPADAKLRDGALTMVNICHFL